MWVSSQRTRKHLDANHPTRLIYIYMYMYVHTYPTSQARNLQSSFLNVALDPQARVQS